MAFERPIIYTNEDFHTIYEKAGVEHSRYFLETPRQEILANKVLDILKNNVTDVESECVKISEVIEKEHGLEALSIKLSAILKSEKL